MTPTAPTSVFVRRLFPSNLLSFGPNSLGVELRPLNLLVGANGSGKSNFIEAVRLMRAAPKELEEVTRQGGGVGEWIFKGAPDASAGIAWHVEYMQNAIEHNINFRSANQVFTINRELIFEVDAALGNGSEGLLYHFNGVIGRISKGSGRVFQPSGPIDAGRSVLAQRRDPGLYPELTWLAQEYERIRIYQEWNFGRKTVFREPQRADMRNDVLAEDFSNIGLYLNRLRIRFPAAKRKIIERLKDLYEGIQDFDVLIEGGTVQVFFNEGDFIVPATRLSDGTLRYLCLLAILCDPEPPPLICIEEPELGLHPDILPKVAELLREAATRTQLIVTTHSDILVDAMTETPEVVVVCSKVDGETRMERLEAVALQTWLEKYRLGELWTRGEIGGTRW